MHIGPNISIKEYWRRVREIERSLPDVVALVSIPPDPRFCNGVTPGAQFIEATGFIAAKCLFAGTHRLATPDEVAAQETKREIDLRDLARRHLAKQGIVAIQLPAQGSSE